MEQVSMNDGLDGRETIAFGLTAGEIAVFVLCVMTAYAVLRSGLPGAFAWALAVAVVGGGAALAWGRVAGRPLLEWVVLWARFVVRTRRAGLRVLRGGSDARRRGSRSDLFGTREARGHGGYGSETGALVIRLARRPPGDVDEPDGPQPGAARRPLRVVTAGGGPRARGDRSLVVTFFSLRGGTGRTTLAVEVAALLAVRARGAGAAGGVLRRVALLDAAERAPGVGLRLGLAPASALPSGTSPSTGLRLHQTGLLVGIPAAPAGPQESPAPPQPAAWIQAAEDAGAGVVVVDIDCDLGPRCLEVLRRCDRVVVTLTPTASGVVDAYQSTAVLRRLGLRDRIAYLVNRGAGGIDLGETMADLGGAIEAAIPDDRALVEAENRHGLAGVDGQGELAEAFTTLARAIEVTTGWEPLAATPRWGSHAR